jgi:hypothetical protein
MIQGGFMQTQTNTSSRTILKDISPALQICIQNCFDCYQICTRTIEHCLSEGSQHSELKHIKLLQDCADICNISAKFMLRSSDFHPSTCGVCAEICNACAKSCEAMADGDDQMKACAEAFRKCASSCQNMAKIQ